MSGTAPEDWGDLMDLDAKLDVDLVAVQAEDIVTCLLTLTAPIPDGLDSRPGECLIAVVDRSGSMRGGRIESVRIALHSLVDRLKPQDTFGVVVFDDQALVHVPARRIDQHDIGVVHQLIETIHVTGTTDLSAGYLLGLSEARRHVGATGAAVVLLSDGRANRGITSAVKLGELAATSRTERITTTTIGIGNGYDETILSEIATQGSGSHRFALTDDDAIAVVSEEAGDLLNKAIVNAVLRIRPHDAALLQRIATFQNLPRWQETDADGNPEIVIALGDLYAGEQREVLLRIDVPALDSLGLHHLADLRIGYVAMPDLIEQAVTWPLAVNVVPGDQAAGRIPNPTVTTARLLAETTQAKRDAADSLTTGKSDEAIKRLEDQGALLRERIEALDPADPATTQARDRLIEEREQLDKLVRGVKEREARASRKSLMEDYTMESTGKADYARRSRSRDKRDF